MSEPRSGKDDHQSRASYGRRHTECPLCGSTECGESLRLPEALIYQCDACRFSFRADPFHPLEHEGRTDAQLAAIDASKVPMFERLLSGLGTPGPGDLMVDIGASSGYFVEFAGKAGWKAVGIEYGEQLAKAARKAGRCVVVGNGESVPVRSGTATALTYWDVLDQFDHPRAALAEAARVLAAGGTLALRVRHGGVHQFMRRRRWLPGKFSTLQNNLYSPESLRKALAETGFENVRIGVAPATAGDPYRSMRGIGAIGLTAVKLVWVYTARAIAFVSARNLLIGPSIEAIATRGSGRSAR